MVGHGHAVVPELWARWGISRVVRDGSGDGPVNIVAAFPGFCRSGFMPRAGGKAIAPARPPLCLRGYGLLKNQIFRRKYSMKNACFLRSGQWGVGQGQIAWAGSLLPHRVPVPGSVSWLVVCASVPMGHTCLTRACPDWIAAGPRRFRLLSASSVVEAACPVPRSYYSFKGTAISSNFRWAPCVSGNKSRKLPESCRIKSSSPNPALSGKGIIPC